MNKWGRPFQGVLFGGEEIQTFRNFLLTPCALSSVIGRFPLGWDGCCCQWLCNKCIAKPFKKHNGLTYNNQGLFQNMLCWFLLNFELSILRVCRFWIIVYTDMTNSSFFSVVNCRLKISTFSIKSSLSKLQSCNMGQAGCVQGFKCQIRKTHWIKTLQN